MFPLRDVIPSRTTPFVTVAIIIVNVLAFLFEQSLGPRGLDEFIQTHAFIPANFALSTIFTSMFLHGSWFHVGGNMWSLWIFGDNVEDRLGHGRFVLFYFACGAAAALAHAWVNPASRVPTIGASGAIAGVMGAYFVLYPNSRVLALVPLVIIMEVIEVPAIVFLGIWFLMQFFSGVGSLTETGVRTGGVAFWAHVAGFLSGIAGVMVLKKPSRTRWAT